MDWVRNFYAKQYEWADWPRRWSDFDPNDRDPRVDAVARHAGSEPLWILELGSGTGTTAAALAVAGHDVVAIEIQGELAAYTGVHPGACNRGDRRIPPCDRGRCYSPADLRLLLEGTGLSVVDVEPFTDEGYS